MRFYRLEGGIAPVQSASFADEAGIEGEFMYSHGDHAPGRRRLPYSPNDLMAFPLRGR